MLYNSLLISVRGEQMPRKGDAPGKGIYVCLYCGAEVELQDNEDVLPGCPECSNALYY
jgi:hypothetical protein